MCLCTLSIVNVSLTLWAFRIVILVIVNSEQTLVASWVFIFCAFQFVSLKHVANFFLVSLNLFVAFLQLLFQALHLFFEKVEMTYLRWVEATNNWLGFNLCLSVINYSFTNLDFLWLLFDWTAFSFIDFLAFFQKIKKVLVFVLKSWDFMVKFCNFLSQRLDLCLVMFLGIFQESLFLNFKSLKHFPFDFTSYCIFSFHN